MRNFLVIADQDRGKTFFVKNEILRKFQSRKNYIFDINMEYSEFKNEIRYISNRDNFLSSVPSAKGTNANVVFEEASAFFSKAGSTSKNTIEHICRRFHSGNINVFVFHALDQVPTDIMLYIDFTVIFRTLDDPIKIHSKFAGFPKIIEAFDDVRSKTEGTRFDRHKKSYPNDYSKQFFHYKRVVAK